MSNTINNTLFQSGSSWKIQQQCKINNTRLGLFIKMVHINDYKLKKEEDFRMQYLKRYLSNKDQINFLLSRKRLRKQNKDNTNNYTSIRLYSDGSNNKNIIHSNFSQQKMKVTGGLKQRASCSNNILRCKTKSSHRRLSLQKTHSSVDTRYKKNKPFTINAIKIFDENPQDIENFPFRSKTNNNEEQIKRNQLKFNYSNKSINSLTAFQPDKNKVQRKYLLKTVSKKMKIALLNTRSFHKSD